MYIEQNTELDISDLMQSSGRQMRLYVQAMTALSNSKYNSHVQLIVHMFNWDVH